jgi:hypothetical protein
MIHSSVPHLGPKLSTGEGCKMIAPVSVARASWYCMYSIRYQSCLLFSARHTVEYYTILYHTMTKKSKSNLNLKSLPPGSRGKF